MAALRAFVAKGKARHMGINIRGGGKPIILQKRKNRRDGVLQERCLETKSSRKKNPPYPEVINFSKNVLFAKIVGKRSAHGGAEKYIEEPPPPI